jgi:uncharacterized protein (DUF952 family)
METILHICERINWENALKNGSYQPASLQSDGFIHCSTPKQILGVANSFYTGRQDLLLLQIKLDAVGVDIRWEKPLGPELTEGIEVSEAFPHIYGPLNLDAVIAVDKFSPDSDGKFHLTKGI